ncbi:porin [Candidatus Desulfobacillus denitrificans]|uniref:Porin n=1 Tax=Candidatus Desulfobacillus denitrificans TaxID=2608985 RepID=A0A809RKL0_9PROT|nr:porin [Candidatus Desulfobacillus denitrificans]
MQKKLIAAAITGLLAVPAMAQTNVTISGQMRVGVDWVSAGGATAAGASPVSRMRVIDNNSNIKFAGTEALGNGLTAWWEVESAIGTSDNVGTSGMQTSGAANNATIGTRNTAVGIKGAWGNIYVGKWDMHYHTGFGVDGAGALGGLAMGANSLNMLMNQGTAVPLSGAGGRLNNAIMYDTPTWNGFNVRLGYSTSAANEILTNLPGVGGSARKESNWWLNPQYNNGPWTAFYSYFARNNIGNTLSPVPPAVHTAAPDARFHRAGIAYTFAMGLKVGAIWDRNSVDTDVTAMTPTMKRTAWAIPVQYNMGPHTFNFTYARAGDSSNTPGMDTSAKMYMLGYTYALSKRTMLGVNWTKINNAAAGTYDLWHPSSNIAAQAGGVLPAGADPRQFGVNLHHSF